MAITNTTRRQMEDLIYKTFDILDPTKANSDKYRRLFSLMTLPQFDAFFKKFINNHEEFLTLDVAAYERDVKMANVEKAAKYLDVPLFEYVAMPDAKSSRIVTTPRPVPVGYIHIKRLQQMARKKNSTSIDITKRDMTTGQLTGDGKVTQYSIDENYGLMTLNAKACLKEFLSMRADDMVMKQEAYSKIRKDGYVELKSLTDDISNKVAVNTLDVYLLCMHVKSDVVSPSYVLKSTLLKKGE